MTRRRLYAGDGTARTLCWLLFALVCGLCAGGRLRALGRFSAFGVLTPLFDLLFEACCPVALLLCAGSVRWGRPAGALTLFWQACWVAGGPSGAVFAAAGAVLLVLWSAFALRVLSPVDQLPAWLDARARIGVMAGHFPAAALTALLAFLTVLTAARWNAVF